MPWPVVLLGDLLVVGGLGILTLALLGVWRFPDLFARIHATAKVGSLGLSALLLGSVAVGEGPLVARALLIAVFLVFTAPVASYVVARSAYRRGPGADDAPEDERGELTRPTSRPPRNRGEGGPPVPDRTPR